MWEAGTARSERKGKMSLTLHVTPTGTLSAETGHEFLLSFSDCGVLAADGKKGWTPDIPVPVRKTRSEKRYCDLAIWPLMILRVPWYR